MSRIYPYFLAITLLITSALGVAPGLAAAQALNVPQGSASLNWAGYVASQTNTSYTAVGGTWVVPTASTPTANTSDATWVGIGGVQQTDLIQAGTQAIVDASGNVAYSAWIETLPNFSKQVSLAVHPGDSVSASIVQQSSGTWLVTINDNTTSQQYQTTLNYNSSLSSAEWVEEMVSNANGTFRPLDNFGSVNFTQGSATVNGQAESMSAAQAQPLQMVNSASQTLATASALGSDGASFSVSRTSNPVAVVTTSTTRRFGQGAAAGFGGGNGRRNRWHMIQTATSTGGVQSIEPTTINMQNGSSGYQYTIPGWGVITVEWR